MCVHVPLLLLPSHLLFDAGDTLIVNERNNIHFTSNRNLAGGNLLVENQEERAIALKAEIDQQKTRQKDATERRDEFRSQLRQVKDQLGAIDLRLKSIMSEIRKQKHAKKRLEEDLADMQAEQVSPLTLCNPIYFK